MYVLTRVHIYQANCTVYAYVCARIRTHVRTCMSAVLYAHMRATVMHMCTDKMYEDHNFPLFIHVCNVLEIDVCNHARSGVCTSSIV